MIQKNCKYCNKIFNTVPSRIKAGKGKYCSRKCAGIHRIKPKKDCSV